MLLHPINMLWVQGPLPWYALASIKSFTYHKHKVILYTYDKDYSPIAGCCFADASEILPREAIFGYRDGIMKGHLSGFADWFRYELLRTKGGWWSDTDIICMRPFIADNPYLFASCWEPDFPDYVNNNVIYIKEPNTEIMTAAATLCRQKGDMIQHAETGPVLLNTLVNEFKLTQYVAKTDAFNPIHYRDLFLLAKHRLLLRSIQLSRILRGLRPISLSKQTMAIHLFSALFCKSYNFSTAREIPKTTFLWHILNKNGCLS